jgi:hypothetical protein
MKTFKKYLEAFEPYPNTPITLGTSPESFMERIKQARSSLVTAHALLSLAKKHEQGKWWEKAIDAAKEDITRIENNLRYLMEK